MRRERDEGRSEGLMRPLSVMRPRVAAAALGLIVITAGATGCERSSWSSSCADLYRCEIEITGTSFHEMPRPWTMDKRVNAPIKDRIALQEATEGGEAVFRLEGRPRCTEGGTFTYGDTLVTCLEVGDNSVKIRTHRGAA